MTTEHDQPAGGADATIAPPIDPQAAIDRLNAMLPSMRKGNIMDGMLTNYSHHADYSDAVAAFAADIETLASLTQVGWCMGVGITGGKPTRYRLDEQGPAGPKWFPVYARLPQ